MDERQAVRLRRQVLSRSTRGFSRGEAARPSGIPVYFGGASDAAIEVAGKHADIYALWGETHAQVRELIGRVRAAAAAHGRPPRFSLSLRPILADTEEAAWAQGRRHPGDGEGAGSRKAGFAAPRQRSGRTRARAACWPLPPRARASTSGCGPGIAALTGAKGNSTSLVGTPDQVADAMLDYYDLGITTFLIRGFDPIADALQYGQRADPARARARGGAGRAKAPSPD